MRFIYFTLISNLLVVCNVFADHNFHRKRRAVDDMDDKQDSNKRTVSFLHGAILNNLTPDMLSCERYERLKWCGCKCTELCKNRNKPANCLPEVKEMGCFCLQGFYRNTEGNCVPEDQCDSAPEGNVKNTAKTPKTSKPSKPVCKSGEIYNDCGSKCMESCDTKDSPTLCITFGPIRCDTGCFCPKGYFRNERAVCVPEKQCEIPKDIKEGLEEMKKTKGAKARKIDITGTTEEPTLYEIPDTYPNGSDDKDDDNEVEDDEEPVVTTPVEVKPKDPKDNDEEDMAQSRTTTKPRVKPTQPNHMNKVSTDPSDEEENMAKSKVKTTMTPIGAEDIDDEDMTQSTTTTKRTLKKTKHNVFTELSSGDLIDPKDEDESMAKTKVKTTSSPNKVVDNDEEERHELGTTTEGMSRTPSYEMSDREEGESKTNSKTIAKPSKYDPEYEDSDESWGRTESNIINPNRPTVPQSICASNEVYTSCGSRCKESIEFMNELKSCPEMCEFGCFCDKGFYRNDRHICVEWEEPIISREFPEPVSDDSNCADNEDYNDCGNRCMESSKHFLKASTCDTSQCDVGCFCRPGYYRNAIGVCVSPPVITTTEKCDETKSCPQNEEYVECGNRCIELMQNIQKPEVCDSNKCDLGCFCVDGYFRESDGICVEPTPPACPATEEFSRCGNRCKESLDNKLFNKECVNECNTGCFCIPGLYRNCDDECVEPPPPCPHNEYMSQCGDRCLELMENINKPSVCPQNKCDFGCFCLEGFKRNKEGLCLPPPPKCPQRETYSDCGNRCFESVVNTYSPSLCDPNHCDIGCFCKPGYYRDIDGECIIPPPPPCPPNEERNECGNRCLESMYFIEDPSICGNPECERGCFCLQGLKRNSKGLCIPPPPKCPERETFSDCGNRCLESSENAFNPRVCYQPICQTGCFCIPGYYRDITGVCNDPPPPPCPQDEAWVKCGNRCLESITSITDPSVCNQYIVECKSGCFCREEYKRNKRGICIPVPPMCPEREVYTDCGNRCLESIENVYKPLNCETNICEKGCFCIPGYYRSEFGCIDPPPPPRPLRPYRPPQDIGDESCPIPQPCPQHEEHVECGNRCIELMQNINDPSICEPQKCDVGCFCIDGYFRESNGMCVEPLGPTCPPAEAFSRCGNRCKESLDNKLFNKECVNECNTGCFCIPGLYRNCDDECVEPPPPCPHNEYMSQCGDRCLELMENINKPSVCPQNKCDFGCFCLEGFKRNKEGLCLPPPPKCPQRETYSDCGNRCFESIVNTYSPSLCDPNQCNIGCFCKPGYYRDIDGECTRPPPPPCPPNEVRIDCGNRCLESMIFINDPTFCGNQECERGCFCLEGLKRNSKGLCIPPPPKCPENEIYSDCGHRCMESIENIDNKEVCDPNICQIGCFCLPGHYREMSGHCVLLEMSPRPQRCSSNSCPAPEPPKCKSFEIYSECNSRCKEMCVNRDQPYVCPTDRCDVGCFCPKGLYRDSNGLCIPPSDCEEPFTTECSTLPPECPTDEVFNQCGSRCNEYCVNRYNPSLCQTTDCETGCFCRNGYFRNNLGICVMDMECDSAGLPVLTPNPLLEFEEQEELLKPIFY